MKQVCFFILLIVCFFVACNPDNVITLKNTENEKITYEASKKRGYRMGIFKQMEDKYIRYAIRLNGNGEVMYIYKTAVNDDDDESAPAGPTWYLVSDTTDTIKGAMFFGSPIIGYYGSRDVNFIGDNNYKGKSSPYLEEEKLLFAEVARLMHDKKQPYIPFDTSSTIFWFKYDIQ